MWAEAGKELNYQAYIDEYITAEIPPEPHPNDKSSQANQQRQYINLIVSSLYHTCKVGRCKLAADEPCNKHYPVIFINNLYNKIQ